jgi:hypothetical protein
MKQNNAKQKLKKATTLLLAGSLFFSQSAISGNRPGEEEPAKKTKSKTSEKTRSFGSLNNRFVKIYPDALLREMHVVAKDENAQLDFFVFDVQGTLVQNYKMKPKDHYRIAGLARGTYIYRVFNGDEETAAGQFEIR